MLDCLVNGEISGLVSSANRGLHYGDGVFETIAMLNGTPRFWQLHMDRLAIACEQLNIPQPPQQLLLREVQTVTAGRGQCVVKILLTRSANGRGYAPGPASPPDRVISAYAFPDNVQKQTNLGIQASICNLRLAIQPQLAGIKHLNRLEQVLARAEIDQKNMDEGILLDPDDHVVCATAANVFLVLNGRLLTPRMDRCGVRGVMRAAILQAFRPLCEQRRIQLDMLPDAQEVFVCNAVRGVIPITRIDHWDYEIGPRTREVQQWLAQQ
ncbi:MAG TPA: aminodeoxychorismate lyase [Xanthomonadales bacterium]|nr:aminodeoxychorismate lyase [Xanthomonadales bacterium]